MVRKDKLGKKSVKIVPLKEPGEPIVVSVPLSKVKFLKLLNNVIYLKPVSQSHVSFSYCISTMYDFCKYMSCNLVMVEK